MRWRETLGHGSVTLIAGRTGYSVGQVSHILGGRKENLVMLAYVAGMAGEPWPVARGFLSADAPVSLAEWWDVIGREAHDAGAAGVPFAVPTHHAAFGARVRAAGSRLRVAQPLRRTTKKPNPPVPRGDKGRRARGASSGVATGNGPDRNTDKTTAHTRRTVVGIIGGEGMTP